MKTFLHDYNLLYNKINSFGTQISTDILGYKLLKASNIQPDHFKLVKATATMEYDKIWEQLKKLFCDSSSPADSSSANILRLDEINLQEDAVFPLDEFDENMAAILDLPISFGQVS